MTKECCWGHKRWCNLHGHIWFKSSSAETCNFVTQQWAWVYKREFGGDMRRLCYISSARLAAPHLQATSSLTQRQEPKRPEHARVQGGPMQLKCGEGGHIEKAGPRVETTSTLCLISAEVQFKCRRSGAKVV